MPGDQFVQIEAADNTGKKVDVSELLVGANTVERQRVVNADPTNPLGLQQIDSDGLSRVRVADNNFEYAMLRLQQTALAIQMTQAALLIQQTGLFVPQPEILPFIGA